MVMEYTHQVYTSGAGILVFPDHYVAFGQLFAKDSSLATIVGTRKIVKAGTVFPTNDEHAQGLVLSDLDVTDGDQNGAVVIHGFIKTSKLPVAVTPEARLAMQGIYFMPLVNDASSIDTLAALAAAVLALQTAVALPQARVFNLGAPIVADDDKLVVSTNMKIGNYTIAAQPDVPRNITVTQTAVGTADTPGTITITGTNSADEEISEVITPTAGSAVAGTKAFKTVTQITGAGWAVDAVEGTVDTIKIGIGNELGLPRELDGVEKVMFALLGQTVTADNATVTTPETLEGTTIDLSAGTYNGTKEVVVVVVD